MTGMRPRIGCPSWCCAVRLIGCQSGSTLVSSVAFQGNEGMVVSATETCAGWPINSTLDRHDGVDC